MVKPKSMDKMLGFANQLSEGKVLGIPHLHCTQWEPSLVLGLLCFLRDGCLVLPIFS